MRSPSIYACACTCMPCQDQTRMHAVYVHRSLEYISAKDNTHKRIANSRASIFNGFLIYNCVSRRTTLNACFAICIILQMIQMNADIINTQTQVYTCRLPMHACATMHASECMHACGNTMRIWAFQVCMQVRQINCMRMHLKKKEGPLERPRVLFARK